MTRPRLPIGHHRFASSQVFAVAVVVGASLCACAGPTTPLGALWVTKPSDVDYADDSDGAGARMKNLAYKGNGPMIRLQPRRQYLHMPKHLRVIIDDPAGIDDDSALSVRYNGLNVTDSFLFQARKHLSADGKKLTLDVPTLRLSPLKAPHSIRVDYKSASGLLAAASLEPPVCRAFEVRPVLSTRPYHPSNSLLRMIDLTARSKRFNPSLATALIAQESSFRPSKVSWARAIGLTQVTPVAEEELSAQYGDWPRYPRLNELPLPILKTWIMLGKVNDHNEWRLNPQLSILGGLTYAQMLAERWATAENSAKINATFDDPEVAYTALVLASYNAGYSRVLAALNRFGSQWLMAPDLTEARRYVNLIFSLCDHFSEEEYSNEDEA